LPRWCPSASISSRNSTAGLWARAAANRERMFRSLAPMCGSSTSATCTWNSRAWHSPAVALAKNVFPQPGGPYNSRPPPAFFPNRSNRSGVRNGCIISFRIVSLRSCSPPTSAKLTFFSGWGQRTAPCLPFPPSMTRIGVAAFPTGCPVLCSNAFPA